MEDERKVIVIKIGTNVLIDPDRGIMKEVVDCYTHQAKQLMGAGYAPVFVTSGAVRLGKNANLGLEDKKALSAVGQARLIQMYEESFAKEGIPIAQLLLSRHDVRRVELFEAFQKTLTSLVTAGVVPLLNENDALTNGEREAFGENDMLAAVVAVVMQASKLVYLTDQFGLYMSDPHSTTERRLVCDTSDVTKEFFKYCSQATSAHGTGGMISKLKGARLAIAGGVETYIANGKVCAAILDLIECRMPATRFYARRAHGNVTTHHRWLLSCRASSGMAMITDDAAKIVKSGETLTAAGVKEVIGEFQSGEIIELVDADQHGIGCGIVQLDSQSLRDRVTAHDVSGIDVVHKDHLITY